MQPFTYHCHTNYSDGQNTAEQMILKAKEIGFIEIGITDHLIVHPFFADESSSMEKRTFDKVKEWVDIRAKELRMLSQKHQFPVYVGYEVDFFPTLEWQESFLAFREKIDYDYLICGQHFIFDETYSKIINSTKLAKKESNPLLQKEYIKRYFEILTQAIYSGYFDFFAHLDFIRWSGLCGAEDFKEDRKMVIKALTETQTPFELNTKGRRSIGDFYPAEWMIKELNQNNIPIVISDDAHTTEELGGFFDIAEDYLTKIGFTNRFSMKDILQRKNRQK